ncbi:MAG: pentapeptide repeat-containing protein [Acidimicrobiales bacterium]|jgi:uncharacterized protein YjbI with pentapeptide repeats
MTAPRAVLVGIVAALALSIGANVTTVTAMAAPAHSDCKAPPAPHVDWAGCNKSHDDLELANLYGANLQHTNLSDAGLVAANLSHAEGADANLTGAVLSDATLKNATLKRANLKRAYLFGANLKRANLTRSDLTRATLTGANLKGSDLKGVTWNDTVCPDGTNSSKDGGTCKGHLTS